MNHQNRPQLAALFLAAACFGATACAEEEVDPGSDAVDDTTDTAADFGDAASDTADTSADTSADSGDDGAPDADVDTESDADTTDAADTGDTTDSGEDADDAADVTDAIDANDAADVIEDADPDVDDCLLLCGLGCVAPEFAPCGIDGRLYCSECEMDCLGVAVAPDRSLCVEDACDPPEDATAVPYAAWTPPEGCSVETTSGFGDWLSNAVYTAEIELEDELNCLDENAISGIDWGSFRLVRAVQIENPSIELRGVAELAGAITVFTASARYCGGAAPPSTAVWLLVPADERSVSFVGCLFGTCPDGPPPP